MNKILFVARKAKGLTEKQVAELLTIEESEYLELECNFKKLSLDNLDKLEAFYNIPAAYFMFYDALDVTDRLNALEQHKIMLSRSTNSEVSAGTHLGLAKLGLENLIICENLKVSMLKQIEIQKENSILRELYMNIKKNKAKRTSKNKA